MLGFSSSLNVVTEPLDPRALFAQRLAQARALRGLSQRGLGIKMGMEKSAGSALINNYEHQTHSVRLTAMPAIARALDVPLAYLLADSAEQADGILTLAEGRFGGRDETALLLMAALQSSSELQVVLTKWLEGSRGPEELANLLIEALIGHLRLGP